MMPLRSLVYCSEAVPGLSVDQIDDLARDAAAHNRIAGVTGVLLSDGHRFLQYIEGPEDGMALTYSRILNSRSHREIVELGHSRGSVRRFPYWSMRWIPVEEPDFRLAAHSEWRGLTQRREESVFQVPTGIDRMQALVRPHIN